MQIVTGCPQCCKRLTVPASFSDKRVRCPGCDHIFRIPVQQVMPPTGRLDSGLDLTTVGKTAADESILSWLDDAEWEESGFAEQERPGSTDEPASISDEFDPYYVFLGISTEEPEIDHYRLLGLKQFETNSDIIEMAADRQMGHLHRHESGEHGELVAKLMSEVSSARICLLNPEKKAVYDAQLREQSAQADKTSPTEANEPASNDVEVATQVSNDDDLLLNEDPDYPIETDGSNNSQSEFETSTDQTVASNDNHVECPHCNEPLTASDAAAFEALPLGAKWKCRVCLGEFCRTRPEAENWANSQASTGGWLAFIIGGVTVMIVASFNLAAYGAICFWGFLIVLVLALWVSRISAGYFRNHPPEHLR